MKNKTPIIDQMRFTKAVVWTLARIAQELIDRMSSSVWGPWGKKDPYLANRILREYKDMMVDEEDN